MNKRIRGMFTLLGALVIFASAGLIAPQSVIASSQQPAYASDRVIVKLKSGKSVSDLSGFANRFNAKVKNNVTGTSSYVVKLPASVTPSSIVNKSSYLLSSFKSIAEISYDYKYYPCAQTIPNDPFYPDQWNLKSAAHIYAPEAWDYYLQAATQEVVVAVLDTGIRDRIAYNPSDSNVVVRIPHPDLDNVLLKNQGYDFGDSDNDPSPSEYSVFAPLTGHGTHVAGIVAAQINNAKGIAGIAPNYIDNNGVSNVKVWILPIKVGDYNGDIYGSSVVNALSWCVNADLTSPATGKSLRVNVVNLSFGGSVGYAPMHQAIQSLVQNGTVVVAGSGNDYNGPVIYPAAYPECISVGATDESNNITDFSNIGSELDIVAPGYNIASTVWDPSLAT
ncbi:MAG: S8 family serine peptidase, partial [Armatimonadota bacterium]